MAESRDRPGFQNVDYFIIMSCTANVNAILYMVNIMEADTAYEKGAAAHSDSGAL